MKQQTKNKLFEYKERFDDIFPLMQYNFTENEVMSIIKKCLLTNKPVEYFYPLKDDVKY